MTNKFNKFLATLTSRPGVYVMYNSNKKVIYVGKANNLKSRVSTYFRTNKIAAKTQALMAQIADIKVTITQNEVEALILESNLIKEYRPRYNVVFKDDKSYPYLMLTINHAFPRLDLHRGAKNKSAKYFGPYPNARAVRENLTLLQKIFMLRQCSDVFFANRSRPCLQYQIKRCTAPCVKYVSESEYAQQVNQCVLFLQGKNEEIMLQLTNNMQQKSMQKNYEQAAQFRDQIARMRKLHANQTMLQGGSNFDVIASVVRNQQAAICVLFIRSGRLLGHKSFHLNVPTGCTVPELLEQFIPQYYFNTVHSEKILDKIILGNKGVNKALLQAALSEKLNKKIKLIERKHPNYAGLQNMATSNAKFLLQQRLATNSIYAQQLQALQTVLKVTSISRIECFDVSHTQGESTVASCVVFSSQGIKKDSYRRYNIKGIQPGDDYAAMFQAIKRRYTRLQKTGQSLPDLIMIDGGVGQLKQAERVVEELQLSGIHLLAVAKGRERKPGKEQLFVPGSKNPILLPHDSMALHLIQQIRDEAHRFAIQAHRKQRGRARVTSKLEQVDGIGPAKRQSILAHFGGMQALAKASLSEIARVKGISHLLAEKIYKALH